MTKVNFFVIYDENDDFKCNLSVSTGSEFQGGPLKPMFQFARISLPADFPFPQTSAGREDFLYDHEICACNDCSKILFICDILIDKNAILDIPNAGQYDFRSLPSISKYCYGHLIGLLPRMNTFNNFAYEKLCCSKRVKNPLLSLGFCQGQCWIGQGQVVLLYLEHLFSHIPSILRHSSP